MDEVVELLQFIAVKLTSIEEEMGGLREEISDIKGFGVDNSISDIADKFGDIVDKLEDLQGVGLYNSVADVNGKLDDVIHELQMIGLKD
ncbi:hypothetical protein LG326_03510 [Metaplanococcus flavidus]